MLEHVLAEVYGQPWAILPSKAAAIAAFIQRRAVMGIRLSAEELKPFVEAASVRANPGRSGAVAVLPIRGALMNRSNMLSEMSGASSYEKLGKQFAQLVDDPGIKAIILDIDSPGGAVYGLDEFAQQIFNARSAKPIVSVSNAGMFSAAYYLGSQAGEVIGTPSGEIGSIGTVAIHQDASKALELEGVTTTIIRSSEHKFEGNPFEPLTEDAKAEIEAQVQRYNGLFENAVARGRGVTVAKVRSDFGQGHIFSSKDAVARGMADRVATLEDTVRRFAGDSSATGSARNESASGLADIEREKARLALAK